MARRIAVHHFVLNLTTRQYGSHPTSDLLGVDYWFTVPEEREFPIYVPKMDLFARFYVEGLRRAVFQIEVWRLDVQGSPQHRVGVYGPLRIEFKRTQPVVDLSFRVANVRIEAQGRYAVLIHRRRSGWQGERWQRLRETHFAVVRP